MGKIFVDFFVGLEGYIYGDQKILSRVGEGEGQVYLGLNVNIDLDFR